jgi:putative oxidoreductase
MDSSIIVITALSARLCLVIIFIPSAVGKFRHWREFIRGAVDYQLLTPPLAKLLAAFLPWAELAIAVMLITGYGLRFAGIAASFLMVFFIVALMINLFRGRSIRCSCYGIADTSTISWGTVARNLVLLALALTVALASPLVLTANEMMLLWNRDFQAIREWAIVILLLVCFSLSMIMLTAWSLDIYQRISHLKVQR